MADMQIRVEDDVCLFVAAAGNSHGISSELRQTAIGHFDSVMLRRWHASPAIAVSL
jgi:hypothetical protein